MTRPRNTVQSLLRRTPVRSEPPHADDEQLDAVVAELAERNLLTGATRPDGVDVTDGLRFAVAKATLAAVTNHPQAWLLDLVATVHALTCTPGEAAHSTACAAVPDQLRALAELRP